MIRPRFSKLRSRRLRDNRRRDRAHGQYRVAVARLVVGDLVKHPHLAKGVGAIEISFAQDADLPRVEAVEAAYRVDALTVNLGVSGTPIGRSSFGQLVDKSSISRPRCGRAQHGDAAASEPSQQSGLRIGAIGVATEFVVEPFGDQQALLGLWAASKRDPEQAQEFGKSRAHGVHGTGRPEDCGAAGALVQFGRIDEAVHRLNPAWLKDRAGTQEHEPGRPHGAGCGAEPGPDRAGGRHESTARDIGNFGGSVAGIGIRHNDFRDQASRHSWNQGRERWHQ